MDTYQHVQVEDGRQGEIKRLRSDLAWAQLERNKLIASHTLWRARALRSMVLIATLAAGLLFFAVDVIAQTTEDDYNRAWCAAMGGRAEVRQIDRTRIDCLTSEYAIETDFAGKSLKTYEAIGQAIHYSRMSGKRPGVLLIITDPKDCRFVARARMDAAITGVWVPGQALQPIKVWTVGGSCAGSID